MDVNDYLTTDNTSVQLNDVCVYTTPELSPESMILKHLTVTAHKSEIIGMVGRTGPGKTTLLSALQNISTNRTGQVLFDGKDLNDIPNVILRQIIGVLPQLPFVFKGWTLRRFVDPRRLFTDEEINQALNKCALLKFVNEPPEEDLAEQTSARSNDIGVQIYDSLHKYFDKCTTFVTAHDVNVLKTCTSVWVIHEGCLVRRCKTSDIAESDLIHSIIEESVYNTQ